MRSSASVFFLYCETSSCICSVQLIRWFDVSAIVDKNSRWFHELYLHQTVNTVGNGTSLTVIFHTYYCILQNVIFFNYITDVNILTKQLFFNARCNLCAENAVKPQSINDFYEIWRLVGYDDGTVD